MSIHGRLLSCVAQFSEGGAFQAIPLFKPEFQSSCPQLTDVLGPSPAARGWYQVSLQLHCHSTSSREKGHRDFYPSASGEFKKGCQGLFVALYTLSPRSW